MVKDLNFDSIRPYEDNEIHEVIERLIKEESFIELIGFLYPDFPTQKFIDKLLNIKTIKEFQTLVIYPYVQEIVKHTTKGLSSEGLDKLDPKKSYLFISNHRDIVLDSAILNIILVERGFDTTEIAIGDNLLIFPWITDLVKLNRTFLVNRNLPVRQMLESSKRLSNYIRYTLNEKGHSIWIAQREGRSKDGNDQTQVSLLKMLNISNDGKPLSESFGELHIVPVSISYEYDPCDYLKALEFQQKRDNPNYKKSEADDLKHMGAGLRGRKGRVHFSFGDTISAETLKPIDTLENKNDQLNAIASLIDDQIHSNYKLWPGNFLALDKLSARASHNDKYTTEDVNEFESYINDHLSRIEKGDTEFLHKTLMEMYSNPVRNFLK